MILIVTDGKQNHCPVTQEQRKDLADPLHSITYPTNAANQREVLEKCGGSIEGGRKESR